MRKFLEAIPETTPKERVTGSVAIFAILLSLCTIIIEESSIAVSAGFFAILVALYSIWQQRRLTDIITMKETHEAMKQEVDILATQNKRLQLNVETLSTSINHLKDSEVALHAITETQTQTLSEFLKQVDKNRENLMSMERSVKYETSQNILDVIMNSDISADGTIDGEELELLIQRLYNINGLQFDEDRFRTLVLLNPPATFKTIISCLKDVNGSSLFADDM